MSAMFPSGIRPGVRRLFRLATRRPDTAAEMDEEIRFHIEERVARLVARGMSPDAARAEAHRRFGDMREARVRLHESAKRRERTMQSREIAGTAVQDLRFALRSLRRAPGFLAVAVACLAIGIGANVAIFSVIDGVLLKRLPFAQPERLVRVWPEGAVPLGIFDILTRDQHSFTSLAGYETGRLASVTGNGDPARLLVAATTANLFETLGVQPEVGRTFTRDEARTGADDVVVLSHATWRDRFGEDSGALGRSLLIDGRAHRIVGVMPAEFGFPSAAVAMWTPVRAVAGTPAYWWSTYLRLVGRLKPGIEARDAMTEAAVLLPRARESFPMRMPDEWGRAVPVVSLHEALTGTARPTLLLLVASVGLVLLIACVNVATLYISRASGRAREIAVRAALGGGRGRILRLLFTESVVVASLGALAGLAVAWVALRTLVTALPEGTPRVHEIGLDLRAMGFAVLVSALSAVAFGLLPALRATRADLSVALREGSRKARPGHRVRSSALLAASQIAIAVVLVCGAGLLIKSLWKLQDQDLGFRTEGAFTATVPLPSFPNDTAHRAPLFYVAVLERARSAPGVRTAALTSALPFGDGIQAAAMAVESHPTADGDVPPTPHTTSVSDAYFDALAIPLLRGRTFTPADREGSALVAVIDEAAARTLWPGENPIGRRIRYVWNKDWFTVVGVVGSVKHDSLSSQSEPSLYLPMRQGGAREMRLVVAAAAGAGNVATAMTGAIRAAVRGVDPTVPVGEVRALGDVVKGSAARPRFTTMLLSLFAAVALLLGAVGIYGVVSSGVVQRTREIGVRMAIGATRGEIARMVLRESLSISIAGMVLGMAGAIAASRWLHGMLFEVGRVDVPVYAAVAGLLGVVAVIAAVAPARRAAGVDPLVAMRGE